MEGVRFLEDQRSCRKIELGGLDKTHVLKVARKVFYNETEMERSMREKQR